MRLLLPPNASFSSICLSAWSKEIDNLPAREPADASELLGMRGNREARHDQRSQASVERHLFRCLIAQIGTQPLPRQRETFKGGGDAHEEK